MNESQFNQLIEDTFIQLEDALEELDFDYENQAGILTIMLANGSKIIANKHAGMKQLWLATKENGFHCDWNGSDWIESRQQVPFAQLLSEALSKQSGRDVIIELSF